MSGVAGPEAVREEVGEGGQPAGGPRGADQDPHMSGGDSGEGEERAETGGSQSAGTPGQEPREVESGDEGTPLGPTTETERIAIPGVGGFIFGGQSTQQRRQGATGPGKKGKFLVDNQGAHFVGVVGFNDVKAAAEATARWLKRMDSEGEGEPSAEEKELSVSLKKVEEEATKKFPGQKNKENRAIFRNKAGVADMKKKLEELAQRRKAGGEEARRMLRSSTHEKVHGSSEFHLHFGPEFVNLAEDGEVRGELLKSFAQEEGVMAKGVGTDGSGVLWYDPGFRTAIGRGEMGATFAPYIQEDAWNEVEVVVGRVPPAMSLLKVAKAVVLSMRQDDATRIANQRAGVSEARLMCATREVILVHILMGEDTVRIPNTEVRMRIATPTGGGTFQAPNTVSINTNNGGKADLYMRTVTRTQRSRLPGHRKSNHSRGQRASECAGCGKFVRHTKDHPCPVPQCYNCLGMGHMKEECRSERASYAARATGKFCSVCGTVGQRCKEHDPFVQASGSTLKGSAVKESGARPQGGNRGQCSNCDKQVSNCQCNLAHALGRMAPATPAKRKVRQTKEKQRSGEAPGTAGDKPGPEASRPEGGATGGDQAEDGSHDDPVEHPSEKQSKSATPVEPGPQGVTNPLATPPESPDEQEGTRSPETAGGVGTQKQREGVRASAEEETEESTPTGDLGSAHSEGEAQATDEPLADIDEPEAQAKAKLRPARAAAQRAKECFGGSGKPRPGQPVTPSVEE
jgi:hypothetical protein